MANTPVSVIYVYVWIGSGLIKMFKVRRQPRWLLSPLVSHSSMVLFHSSEQYMIGWMAILEVIQPEIDHNL